VSVSLQGFYIFTPFLPLILTAQLIVGYPDYSTISTIQLFSYSAILGLLFSFPRLSFSCRLQELSSICVYITIGIPSFIILKSSVRIQSIYPYAYSMILVVQPTANDAYNITASLYNILEPKVLTIIICFVLNTKRMLGRDLWD